MSLKDRGNVTQNNLPCLFSPRKGFLFFFLTEKHDSPSIWEPTRPTNMGTLGPLERLRSLDLQIISQEGAFRFLLRRWGLQGRGGGLKSRNLNNKKFALLDPPTSTKKQNSWGKEKEKEIVIGAQSEVARGSWWGRADKAKEPLARVRTPGTVHTPSP